MRAPTPPMPVLGIPRTPRLLPEADIRAMAEALGARLPAFREADAPELFEGWAHRVALADSLRARGEPYADMVAEADRHIGQAPPRQPLPPILPLSDWLGEIARALGADLEIQNAKLRSPLGASRIPERKFASSCPRTSPAAVAAPLT